MPGHASEDEIFTGVAWNGCEWEIHRDDELELEQSSFSFEAPRELRRRVADAAARFGRLESPNCVND